MLEKLNLDGKVALVTGGGTGLGREMALAMARAGADIVIAGRRPGPLEETAQKVRETGMRALALSADVTDLSQVASLVSRATETFGHIDILINNAGYPAQQQYAIWDVSDEEWHAGIEANLSSAFYCSRALAKQMVQRGRGRIINISSGAGIRSLRDNYMYSVGKAGLVAFTKALAMSLGRFGVTSNCIVPGSVPTKSRDAAEGAPPPARNVPVGRVGLPQEIGPLAVFLASDASDYMNGQTFFLDGGAFAGGVTPTGYIREAPSLGGAKEQT
ncbi:MAG: SDR family oxidoreductase [Chloroflexi bacterium]|nr:SDR family oxidoreductase [Chloroflexota bacterium]